jgi:hypothetical protein
LKAAPDAVAFANVAVTRGWIFFFKRMPFDESLILEVAKQLSFVQKTPVNQNLARQLLELAASNKNDIEMFGKDRPFSQVPTQNSH